jgi:glycosyltransferase involved in cell wall biosynthesis
MRILNVTESYAPFYEFGGPPAKVEALSRGLAKRGNLVTVLTADWGIEERTAKTPQARSFQPSPFGWAADDGGVKAVYLPTWIYYRATSWNPAAGRYLRARLDQFDVVHIFGLYDLLGPAAAKECRRQNVPYVVEPIGMFVPIVRNVQLKRLYHYLYGERLIAGAARVIATSEQEAEELGEGGIPKEKIVLRRNGVMQPERIPERGFFRAAKNIPQSAFVILFLGRLSEKKSPDLLLRAFSSLPAQVAGRTLWLVFAGQDEKEKEAKLKEMVKKLGVFERIQFTGAVFGEEKWAAYRDADVFVLPSQNENFGNTAAESAAVGTPVIVTERCGIASLLTGAATIIPHQEAALAEAMKSLLQDESMRIRLGRRAVEAASKIGWEEPVTETESLYRMLAKKR